jgi:hypothetical protein
MGYYWLSTEARTGRIITDLPLLDVGSVKQSVGRYETTSATLPVSVKDAPADWVRATKKGTVHLILLADNPNDPAHGIPLIGYMVTRRKRNQTDQIGLDMVTAEAYFDQRYVGDKTYAATGQNAIVADLVNSFALDGAGGKQGIPIRVQYTGAGKLRDKTYKDTEDKTIYSALTDLAGILGGPEWYFGWEWQTNPERITPVLYVADRVGSPVTAGLAPNATFEIPGQLATFELIEDNAQGKGATDVMATSSGQGDIRPQSPRQVIIDPDQPNVEYRFTPSTSITDTATLTDHAAVAVAAMHNGAVAFSGSAVAAVAPKLGAEWFLGDVGFVVGGPDAAGVETVPAFPGGIKGVARAVGWDLTLGNTPIITPTLISAIGAFL